MGCVVIRRAFRIKAYRLLPLREAFMETEKLIAYLKHPDREIRRKAILQLAKSEDRRALPALGEVYKSDADPELRDLALKAGRYLKEQTKTMPTAQINWDLDGETLKVSPPPKS